jgi:hypothetical protein
MIIAHPAPSSEAASLSGFGVISHTHRMDSVATDIAAEKRSGITTQAMLQRLDELLAFQGSRYRAASPTGVHPQALAHPLSLISIRTYLSP